MLDYLYQMGGDLDHMDIAELNQELLKPWDHVEAPATMFARGDRIECQLIKAGQMANPSLCLAFALSNFEASGKYDAAVQEWKAKAARDKTFPNF